MGRAGTNLQRRPDAEPLEPVSARHADANRRQDYEQQCALLRDRIEGMYRRFEERHHFPPGMGRNLLLQTGLSMRAR